MQACASLHKFKKVSCRFTDGGPGMEGETHTKEFNVYAKLDIFDGTDALWLIGCNSL